MQAKIYCKPVAKDVHGFISSQTGENTISLSKNSICPTIIISKTAWR